MNLRTLFLLIVLELLAAFTALNWSAFTAPMTLSLAFTSVQAPLGLIMLGATAVLGVAFLLYVTYLQSTSILESRRLARELHAQRQLADEAEASRFTELRTFFEQRMTRLDDAVARTQSVVQSTSGTLQSDLRGAVEQSTTVLSAYIGEVEDRLERKLGTTAATPPA